MFTVLTELFITIVIIMNYAVITDYVDRMVFLIQTRTLRANAVSVVATRNCRADTESPEHLSCLTSFKSSPSIDTESVLFLVATYRTAATATHVTGCGYYIYHLL